MGNRTKVGSNAWRCARKFICRHLCGQRFFNSDASYEIDRLTVALERTREEVAAQELTDDARGG